MQPLGVPPWPAGMLLLPPGPGVEAVAAALVAGREPAEWPEELAFVRLALRGDPRQAVRLVAGDDARSRYNRAVLVGGPDDWEALREEVLAAADAPLAALVETARFSLGLTDVPPGVSPDASLPGEVEAVARAARASAAIEAGAPAAAAEELDLAAAAAAAAERPLLSAALRGTRAEVLRTGLGEPAAAAAEATTALALLPPDAAEDRRAELLVARALARQEAAGTSRPELLAAVQDFQEALKTYRESSHPEQFALCNLQLAVAYLVLPMTSDGDRIRQAVAVNALRSSLRVFRPETHPVEWASAQMNLANSLQYLPSAHRRENLLEAVRLYDEILERRDGAHDPSGAARLLANQGNAMAHLGMLTEAAARLRRARELFSQAGMTEETADVDATLAELDRIEVGSRAGEGTGEGRVAGRRAEAAGRTSGGGSPG